MLNMEMNKSNKRFKVKRQVVAIMVLGIPLIGSFQNCGPNKMDFDVDQPALIIDAPIATRPKEPGAPSSDNSSGGGSSVAGGGTTGEASGGGSSGGAPTTGGDSGSTAGNDGGSTGDGAGGNAGGGIDGGDSSSSSPGQSSSDSASINSPSSGGSSPSLDSPVGDEPISNEVADAEADKSDDVDLTEGISEIIPENQAPASTGSDDKRANEKMSYICRVKVPNSKRVSTVKFRDGVFNPNGVHYRNKAYVVCMSQFSCENLIGGKLEVKKAVKRKFCDRETKKRLIHMTREDIAGLLK